MIEQLMIFALGFLCAGLVALLFLPAVWRRAQRLSRRQLEMQLPLSLAEIAAERDQLRAKFAIERRRIEQTNESLNEARARDLTELGRRGVALANMTQEAERLRSEGESLRESLAAAERRLASADGLAFALQKDVYDSAGLLERRTDDLAQMTRQHEAALDLAEARRAEIAGLETQIEGLRASLEETERTLATARLQLAERTSAVVLMEREREYARSDLAAANQRREALQQIIDELNERLEIEQQSLREAQRARARMANEIADQARALEAAQSLEAELRAALDDAARAGRDEARRAAERAQSLRAERDSLQGALEAVRREAQDLRETLSRARQENAQTTRGKDAAEPSRAGEDRAQQGGQEREQEHAQEREDAVLRKAISEVGAEVLRLADALDRAQAREGAQAGAQAGGGDKAQDTAQDSALAPAERMQRLQKEAGRAGSMA